jgi:hypothetical protein
VGEAFAPGFLLTAIMTLATAWTPSNPYGPSYDPNGAIKPHETREAVARAVRLMVQAGKQDSDKINAATD